MKDRHTGDIEVTSSVVTITDDMADGNGDTIPGSVPDPEAADGYELKPIPTESPVVDCYSLESATKD
ncbi:hypothetical protein BB347_13595 [Natronorubrum daqingense]|nr:hypothetical protein BB347_13595 [Natronorubrum daqingense]